MKFAVLMIFFIFSFPISAQQNSNDPIAIEIVKSPNFAEDHEHRMAAEMIEKTHEIIEGDESGSFLRNWRENFRFQQKAIDGYRWVSMHRGTPYETLVTDGVFLFGLTHVTEMLSGPIAMSVSISQGWPEWITAIFGGVGTIISVPGLDPLCIITFAIYSKSPRFQKFIGRVRWGIVRGVQSTLKFSRADRLLQRVFARHDLGLWLSRIEHLKEIREDSRGRVDLEFHYEFRDQPLKVLVELTENRAYVKEVTMHVSHADLLKDKNFETWLKPLGWNAANFLRSFLQRAQQQPESSWEKAYLESHEIEGQIQRVIIKDSAVSISAPWKSPWTSREMGGAPRCESLFAR
ncbi:MAG: hypothetical protein K2Q26_09805 [Bdellovibrionales bacterium]|nr:hypothetical protein [Bdellovibrionales bacterium]